MPPHPHMHAMLSRFGISSKSKSKFRTHPNPRSVQIRVSSKSEFPSLSFSSGVSSNTEVRPNPSGPDIPPPENINIKTTPPIPSYPQQVLKRRIIAVMPDGSARTSAWTPAGSLQKLNTLSDSKLAKFCTKSAQGQLAACQEILGCLVQARGPNIERAVASGGFLQVFISLLANFCKHDAPHPTIQDQVVTLYGKDALLAKYDIVSKTGDGQLSLAHLEPFHMYHWLLTRQQLDEIETRTASVIGAGASKASIVGCRLKAKTPPEEASASTAEARAKRAKKATADADTNTLFE